MLQNHAKIRFLVKKVSYRFLKHGLEVELFRETCKRGVISQHRCLVTLKVPKHEKKNARKKIVALTM